MIFQWRKLALLGCTVGLFGPISIFSVHAAIAPQRIAAPEKATAMMLKLPLSFEENVGQTNGNAKFIARAPGFTLFATPTEMVTVMNPIAPAKERAIVRTQLAGADRSARLRGEDEQSVKSNYLVGNDPKKWVSGAAHYARVRQAGVYPGVDLVYHGDNAGLEYDFVVAPGADPTRIRLIFSGTEKIVIDSNGDLKLITKQGELTQRKPIVYQDFDGERRSVASEYVRLGKHEVGFKIGAYDRLIELVIDPVVEYATYFGGSGSDFAKAIAVDNSGNAYIAGTTNSTDFPVVAPAIKATNASFNTLIFVSKINTVTNTLIYSTYLGGALGTFDVSAIAVDGGGSLYVAGSTGASDFPIVNGFQPANAGGVDAILAKLSPSGGLISFSTYLGGSSSDIANGLAIDNSGKAYIVGQTDSIDFPTKSAMQSTINGLADAYIVKIDTAAKTLVYSTYLGGSSLDKAFGVAVDSTGHTYVAGQTLSTDFPTTSGAYQQGYQQLSVGSPDGFVSKISANGQSLDYSTFLGRPSVGTTARAVALNLSGGIVVVGSSMFGCPVSGLEIGTTAFQNGFLASFDATGSTVTASACIGAGPLDDLAISVNDSIFVTGLATGTIPITVTTTLQPSNRFLFEIFPRYERNCLCLRNQRGFCRTI